MPHTPCALTQVDLLATCTSALATRLSGGCAVPVSVYVREFLRVFVCVSVKFVCVCECVCARVCACMHVPVRVSMCECACVPAHEQSNRG